MADKNNPYNKPDASREPLEIKKTSDKVPAVIPALNISGISDNYTKQEGSISSALFVIVSGGEKKERQYFAKISDFNTFPRINIYFISKKGQGLTTKELVVKANEIKERLDESNSADTPDSFYLISDRDHFYPEILSIKPECIEKGFNLIVSNPCFEIWLYYSYYSEKPTDFEIPINVKEISKKFKTYLEIKTKGGIDQRVAIFEIEKAISNSEKNYDEDENGIPTLFSTNMFLLCKGLLALIQPELDSEKKREAIKKDQYKRK